MITHRIIIIGTDPIFLLIVLLKFYSLNKISPFIVLLKEKLDDILHFTTTSECNG
jgi:hypothetical protein